MTTDMMTRAIASNEAASKKLDKLYDLKLNGFLDKYTVAEIIAMVYDKYCKEAQQ